MMIGRFSIGIVGASRRWPFCSALAPASAADRALYKKNKHDSGMK
jgi:hypothetical protein